MISKANNVINSIPAVAETTVSDVDLRNLEAECLFLRAISYFDLVRVYAQPYTYAPESLGVPIVLVTENGTPARNTVAEVYDRIITDLTRAESIIGDDYSRSGAKEVRATVTLPAIQALLSRVYLYMGEWQNSADYATLIIDNDDFAMYAADEYTTWDADGVWGNRNIFFSRRSNLWCLWF